MSMACPQRFVQDCRPEHMYSPKYCFAVVIQKHRLTGVLIEYYHNL
jgi:hypothetical protein